MRDIHNKPYIFANLIFLNWGFSFYLTHTWMKQFYCNCLHGYQKRQMPHLLVYYQYFQRNHQLQLMAGNIIPLKSNGTGKQSSETIVMSTDEGRIPTLSNYMGCDDETQHHHDNELSRNNPKQPYQTSNQHVHQDMQETNMAKSNAEPVNDTQHLLRTAADEDDNTEVPLSAKVTGKEKDYNKRNEVGSKEADTTICKENKDEYPTDHENLVDKIGPLMLSTGDTLCHQSNKISPSGSDTSNKGML